MKAGALSAGAVVVACAAGTVLLLSGWTPGPAAHQPSFAATPAAVAPARPVARTTRKARRAPAKTAAERPLSPAGELFAQDCGFCHRLAAARTTGRVGPDLDKLRPSMTRVVLAIRNGGRGTGLMPPDIVYGADAVRLAQFVQRATRSPLR